jgi:glycosidase
MRHSRLIARPFLLQALIFLLLLFATLADARQGAPALRGVPEWSRRAVWYRIVPDRFSNGDAMNDPKEEDVAGASTRGNRASWRMSPWTADWYALQPWETGDTASGSRFDQIVSRRRYGGDLQGVLKRFDQLTRLGVNAISFSPLFDAPSLLGNDPTTFHHIDRHLGPDPLGDTTTWGRENPGDHSTWRWSSADKLFLKLVKEAHKRGVHVMLDLRPDRVGSGFWANLDRRRSPDNSDYAGWFAAADSEAAPGGAPGRGEEIRFGSDSLGLLPGPRAYVAAVVRRWMDPDGDGNPADGIDGWLIYDPGSLSEAYWREFASLVRSINPQALLVSGGESSTALVAHGLFDASADQAWTGGVDEALLRRAAGVRASLLEAQQPERRTDLPRGTVEASLHALSDEWTGRVASKAARANTPGGVLTGRKPTMQEFQRARLAALLQMTSGGAPMLLYGEEMGMWGAGADVYKPMLWGNFIFDAEGTPPGATARAPEPVSADLRLAAWYKTLIALRTAHEALSVGSTVTVLSDTARGLYGYVRAAGKDRLLVVLNAGDAEESVSLPVASFGGAQVRREFLERNGFNIVGGALEFLLRPASGNVFLLEP